MRILLKYQLAIPLCLVVLISLVAISAGDAWLAGRRTQRQMQEQLDAMSRILASSTFPLTVEVLTTLQGLSGADFIVSSASGTWQASNRTNWPTRSLPPAAIEPTAGSLPLSWGDESYFHLAVPLRPANVRTEPQVLHVFYDEQRLRQARSDARWSALLIGWTALIPTLAVCFVMARRVTRPLALLRDHAGEIADGQFTQLALPHRDDEIRDLTAALNHMAAMLVDYEDAVRRNEQLRTLGRLSGGMAHQLRNAVTGCRMGLEWHHRDCPARDDESLTVARRQLDLLQEYVERFLSVGRPVTVKEHIETDLRDVVDSAVSLVSAHAGHLGVELAWKRPAASCQIQGDDHGLVQALLNLLLNAMEAATGNAEMTEPRVQVTLKPDDNKAYCLSVDDNGPGPQPEMADKLFEPLTSDKPEGAGLGLSVVREVAQQHGGAVDWNRKPGRTRFWLNLPRERPAKPSTVKES